MSIIPGPQVASGRMRVDAARAIAKLRDYQLADKFTWILEAVRAAVAAGATSIDLDGDADDVWLRWVGPAWSADELPHLFDELVSPEPAEEGQRLRLLATAVNTALGLEPRFVDVIAIPADGRALRARYQPDVLIAEGDGLRAIAVEDIDRPTGPEGMSVHLHHRVGMFVLGNLLRDEPPELAIVRRACRDVRVPLRVRGETLLATDIVKVPLGDDLRGFLAVTDPTNNRLPTAVVDVAEHGVILVRYELDLDGELGRGNHDARGPIPIRLVIDASRMPTNASRSHVRRNEHPVAAGEERAHQLVGTLIAKLAAEPGERARTAALMILGAYIGGQDWHHEVLPPLLEPLARMQLLKNAVGMDRPLGERWLSTVLVDDEPTPMELAPWLSNMAWIHTRDVVGRQFVGGHLVDHRPARQLIRWAQRQLAAQVKFHRHERREARVDSTRVVRMRTQIGAELPGSVMSSLLFEQVIGELCVHRDGFGGEVVVLLDGRELDRLHVDSPVPYEAVVESARIRPNDRYLGLRRDDGYDALITTLQAAAARAVEAIALELAGTELPAGYTSESPDRVADARLVRSMFRQLAQGQPALDAPVWQTFTNQWRSLAELRAMPAFGIAQYQAPDLDGRDIIRVDDFERRVLPALVACPVIDYEARVLTHRESSGWVAVGQRGITGWIRPAGKGGTSMIQLHHAGVALQSMPYDDKLTPCHIIASVDAAIPSPSWASAVSTGGIETVDFTRWEQAMITALVQAMLGDHVGAVSATAEDLAPSGRAAAAVWSALVRSRDPVKLLGDELCTRLRDHAVFDVHHDPVPKTANELAEMFPVKLAYVSSEDEPVAGMNFLVAEPMVAEAAAVLAGRAVVDGTNDILERRQLAGRQQRLATHRLERPQQVVLAGGIAIKSGWIALGRTAGIAIDLLVEGRPFHTVVEKSAFPIVAVIDVPETDVDVAFANLLPAAHTRVLTDIHAGLRELLLRDAAAKPSTLGDATPLRTLAVQMHEHGWLDGELRRTLSALPAFATVQGARIALDTVARHPRFATWDQPWQAHQDPEPIDPLDSPVLRIPAGDAGDELRELVKAMSRHDLDDVSIGVDTLQGQRRIARGIAPRPAVLDARPDLKKRLDELGDVGRDLGAGEIALVVGDQSTVQLHARGEPRMRVEISVLPVICVAIEAPELVAEVESLGNLATPRRAAITTRAQELAIRLVRKTITADIQLPDEIRRSLREGMFAGRYDASELGACAVIESTAGVWYPYAVIADQAARFGEVWATVIESTRLPLDEARIALRLASHEIARARELGLPIVDGTEELRLDDQARKNLAKLIARDVSIAPAANHIALARLTGDGITRARGTVALLVPGEVERGIDAHRNMRPFSRLVDPCAWPTYARIEHAGLTPDRTWETPVDDDVMKQVIEDVRAASDEAWKSVVMVPDTATVHLEVTPKLLNELPAAYDAHGLQIWGALWLGARDETITVIGRDRVQLAPRRDGIGGRLYVHSPTGWNRDGVVSDLCFAMYPDLIQLIHARRRHYPDRACGHVAMALALGRIRPTEAPDMMFDCFEAPVDADQLVRRLRKPGPVEIANRGSELVAALSTWLGDRARRTNFALRIEPPSPTSVILQAHPPARHAVVETDPLILLSREVVRRLADCHAGFTGTVTVDPKSSTLVSYDPPHLIFGDPKTLTTFVDRPELVELLVAHTAAVLDATFAQLTQSSQATVLYHLLRHH